jgi:STE24 endopeptidase
MAMAGEAPHLDPRRQEQARQYARARRRLWALDSLLQLSYLGLWVAFGWGVELRSSFPRLVTAAGLSFALPWWTSLLLIALIMAAPIALLTLPLTFCSGYRLPHRFGQSTQPLAGWFADLLKGLLLSTLLGAPLLLALFLLLRELPSTWWLWAALGFTLFSTVLATLAPVLILPLFFKPEPLGEGYSTLTERLLQLARSSNTEVRGVYRIDMSRRTKSANAALVGMGATRRILLGDTLLDEFTYPEIETILAHEIGHHVHGDIPRGILLQGGINFLGFYLASEILRWAMPSMGFDAIGDPAILPLLSLVLSLGGLLLMPLSNAYSRWRESLADSFALDLTRESSAFSDAMTRLANQNLAVADPPAWETALFYSHPPLRKRVQMAHDWGHPQV